MIALLLAAVLDSSPQARPEPSPAQAYDEADRVTIVEKVTVTAERRPVRVSDTAASVSIVSKEDLAQTAATTLDDALRQIPGFTLFRRSGSRVANPTAQGVSLRGVGASGASRAAVLVDGIPINDPFGGWVYWGRTPRLSLDRVEVVRGGASSLYGTDALGGVINLIPRDDVESVLAGESSLGGQGSAQGSLFASRRLGPLSVQLSGELFKTDGYVLVDEPQRGLVDTKAGVAYKTLDLRVVEVSRDTRRFFVRGSLFGETRDNGTPLQTNETSLGQFSGGADFQPGDVGRVSVRSTYGSQDFEQTFSSVAAGRNSEALTRRQQTPARHFGASSQWSRHMGRRHVLVAGLEFRDVRGRSDEVALNAGRETTAVSAGGREQTLAFFAQDTLVFRDRLLVTIGGRLDRWRNLEGLATTTPFATNVTESRAFAAKSETAFSPRVSVLYRHRSNLTLTASGYEAFRAPTLNELYRSFRVGNVVTQANERLEAERLTGGEAGVRVSSRGGRLRASGSFFWSEISRPVANVTLSVTPALVTRERRNLGRNRSRGLEVETEARLSSHASLMAGYLFVDATVLSSPGNAAIEGRLLPQIARHQFTLEARYQDPDSISVSLQGRVSGAQFDDDQNLLKLSRFVLLDVHASRRIARSFEFFVATENLLDRRYEVGRTGVTTIGAPRLFRVGLRFSLGPG